jgi:hypothetical protein
MLTSIRHQLFLAREYRDPLKVLPEIKDSLQAILNHPNIVNLVDVVPDYSELGGGFDYMVWEVCEKGSLAQVLERQERDRSRWVFAFFSSSFSRKVSGLGYGGGGGEKGKKNKKESTGRLRLTER